ncbi:T9SS type A sorting domain-containing protein [Prevotella marseillensis]|uniref:T9SS type A sorting domain-containing protein n=1 Tax=Prevotella marseillensis TaxID=2479840 RepID=UPI000F64398B|nr:T9SS type A sorting domain-containing protein [Prevotella marseillensis]
MKKLILLTFLQFCLCSLFAQTDVSTALDLQVGTNSYDLTGQSGYVTLYYKYTAPAESGQLLTFTTVKGEGLSYVMSEDGTYNKMIYGINSATGSIVPVKAGQTVYLILNTRGGSEISFDMKAENAIVEGGQTKEEAIDVTGQSNFFIPSNYSTETYSSVTYLKYECSEEGVLEMTFTGSLSGLSVCEENSSEETSVSLSYVSGTVVGKTEVEAGKVYIIKIKASTSPLIGNFVITHPTIGTSSDMPFTGKAEGNELPAEIGEYWYSYVAEDNGFVMLSSDSYLYGGTVSVYNANSMYSPIASVDGCFLLRFNAVKGNTYLICIEKNEATGSPDLFDMTLVPAGEGDSFNNPKAIELGENTLPQYNGQYYYSITIPGEAGTPKILNISSEADFLSSATNVAVYDQNNMYSSLASGTKDVKVEVSAGNTYIICWNLNEDINGFKYNVSVEDIAQGDVYGNPIPAVVGTNDLKSGSDKYYKYTATLNGWLVISPSDPAVKVQFPMSSGPYPSYRTAVQDGFSIKTEIVKGTEYVIQFSDVTADGTFDLEEVAYGEGESKETAIVVEGSSADVPKSAQTTWYRYVAPADGMLEISSDINYEQNASYQSSTVRVMRDGDSYPVDITKPSTVGITFFGKFGASKDEVFYVQVVTLSAQEGKTVTFNLRDYEPGKLSDNPIELVVGENQLKEASRLNPVWYYADLAEGDLKITADANNYYYMTLYSADDLNNPLAVSGYVYDENYNGSYNLTYTVETPGKYIMKLEQTNPGGALVTMSANIATGISATGLDAENVTVGSGCITVTPSAAGANVSVYDLSGKMVKSAYVKGQTTFNVEKGLYIVRVNNKAIKVVVKD